MWDLSLPGYKYLGPGNKQNKGYPTNPSDRAAQEHDLQYGKYIRQGHNPYTNFNQADEDFLRNVQQNDYGGLLGSAFFRAKRGAANLGILGRLDQPANKRLRGSGSIAATPNQQKEASFSNLQPPTTMGDGVGDGGGSGNAQGLKETPVDNPYVVYRGPPDYTFASLPYVESRMQNLPNTLSADHIYRMTSVYDCRLETVSTDFNAGIGQHIVFLEGEAAQRKARWFDYYAGMYNYYHVIGCQYNVFIENYQGEPLWVYQMFYNDTQPNVAATNEDMQLWPGVRYKYLDRRFLAITSNGQMETNEHVDNEEFMETGTNPTGLNFETTNMVSNDGNSKLVFSGEYKPGQFRRDIHLDSEVENWTAVSTNPSLPEKLLIRLKHPSEHVTSNSAGFGQEMKYKIQVKLNYLVEFKELSQHLKFPVQRQPLTVVIASDVTSAN